MARNQAIMAIFDLPGVTSDQYGEVSDELKAVDAEVPIGRRYHAVATTEYGLRVIDIWELPALLESFVQTLTPILERAGITQPEPTIYPVHNIITGHTKLTETVQDIYVAFQRGDIPAILERLSVSVEWEYGTASNDIPWLQPRRGRNEVAKFFTSLEAIEIEKFVPKMFLEGPDRVVVLYDFDGRVKSTGRRIYQADQVHIWQFDPEGQVVRFCHRVDTQQYVNALED